MKSKKNQTKKQSWNCHVAQSIAPCVSFETSDVTTVQLMYLIWFFILLICSVFRFAFCFAFFGFWTCPMHATTLWNRICRCPCFSTPNQLIYTLTQSAKFFFALFVQFNFRMDGPPKRPKTNQRKSLCLYLCLINVSIISTHKFRIIFDTFVFCLFLYLTRWNFIDVICWVLFCVYGRTTVRLRRCNLLLLLLLRLFCCCCCLYKNKTKQKLPNKK